MACCAALAVILAAVRTVWARMLGRGPVDEVFPPAATWRSGHGIGEPARVARATVDGIVIGRALAATVMVYALLTYLLVFTGLAEFNQDGIAGWFVRDAVLAAVALGLLFLGRRRTATTSALVGVGALWFALGVIDMHVFGAFEFHSVPLVLDAAFHLSGWWLMVAAAGVAVVQRRTQLVVIGRAT